MSPLRHVRIPSALGLVAALLLPLLAESQSAGYKRRSANGRDFPSWEREEDPSTANPLPTARQGRHVVELSIPLDEPASGVVELPDGSLLVALLDGRVQRFSLEGEQLSEVELEAGDPLPPVLAGGRGLVAVGEALHAIDAEGIAWSAELGGPLARPPVLTPAGLSLTLESGAVVLVDPESGEERWSTTIADLSCGPAQSGDLLAWGTTDGRIVALAVADGSRLWDVSVADTISSVGADAESVYFSAKGQTGRSKKSRGPFVARMLVGGKRPSVAWRSRVGGVAAIAPMPLDELVAFACFDGYVHAHERKSGALAWRTDLPARVTVPPRLFGGRLDYLLPLTGWAISIAADNGAVMGYHELEDPDETFIGPPIVVGRYTVVATSFGRLLGLRWEYEPKTQDEG